MVDLLKAFGRGILYVLAFPFFIIVLAIFAVIGLVAFIVQIIKSIIFFFTGQKFFPELPEDRELRLMREAEAAKQNPAPSPAVQPQQPSNNLIFEEVMDDEGFEEEPTPVIAPIKPAPTSVEEACFQDLSIKEAKEEPAPAPVPEPVKEEPLFEEIKEEPQPEPVQEAPTPVEELLPHDDTDPLDDFLSALEEEEEPAPQEDLETYQPRGSELSFQEDENEDTHVGVDIKYDD